MPPGLLQLFDTEDVQLQLPVIPILHEDAIN